VTLDNGSRLSVVIMHTDEANSSDIYFGELLFGPARRASAAPTLLTKLALVAGGDR
jgi:hypothetical protein